MKLPAMIPVCMVLSMVHIIGGASLKSSTEAVSQMLETKGPGKVDVKVLVSSLNEALQGIQMEDKRATDLMASTEKACKQREKDLSAALRKGRRTADTSMRDAGKATAEAASVKESIAQVKEQVKASNQQLDQLQAQLKKLRASKIALKTLATAALKQIDASISYTNLQEPQELHESTLRMDKEADDLERLSESLSFLQLSAPSVALNADKLALTNASAGTQQGIDSEEKEILELTRVEREKIRDLEQVLADLQPALTNKLMQAAEINRTLQTAQRGTERDEELLQSGRAKCDLVLKRIAEQKVLRSQVRNDVLMAAKLLQTMKTTSLLSTDSSSKKQLRGVSLLQLSRQPTSNQALPSRTDEVGEETAALLEERVEDSAVPGNEVFDKVSGMISGLIATLKARANQDVGQNQFCQDGLAQNRRDLILKKNSIDTLSATLRWSQMASTRLSDDIWYFQDESDRTATLLQSEAAELATQTQNTKKELAEHKLVSDVLVKSTTILGRLCGTSLLQRHSDDFSQCKEAMRLLKSSKQGLSSLDSAVKTSFEDFRRLSGAISERARDAQTAHNTALKAARSAKAERELEVARATRDIASVKVDLKFIDDSREELEHRCTKVETSQERMARRADEVGALKEAYNILSGEGIPA